MKALRQAHAFAGLLAALGAGSSALGAQGATRTPPPDAPRILVTALRADDDKLACGAADAIRSRISQDFPYKSLWVISKNDVNAALEASGYPPCKALGPNDVKALAGLMRADEVITGTVSKTAGGYRIEARHALARDLQMAQPLQPVEAQRLDQVAKLLSDQLQLSRKQLSGERRCESLAREGKLPEAAAAAREAIAAFPQSTIARICLAQVFVTRKAQGDSSRATLDSVIAITQEIARLDPRNTIGLELRANAFESTRMPDSTATTWARLISLDPSNARIVERGIPALVRSGRAMDAIPILDEAVKANPGDPSLQRLRWRVLLVADQWKRAIAAGDTLIQLDTAQADTTFFIGQVAAYQADSNVAQAAQAAARGVAKFANNATLGLVLAQLQRQQGQLQQALQTLQRVAATNPKTPNLWLLMGQTYNDLNQPDSAMAALRKGLASGEDSTKVSQFMVVIGSAPYKTCSSNKDVASCQAARSTLMAIDSVAGGKSVDVSFRLGHVNVLLGQALLQDAYENKKDKAKSCDEAKQAQAAFVDAQVNIPKGGRDPRYGPAAGQLMTSLMQLSSTADKQVAAFCK